MPLLPPHPGTPQQSSLDLVVNNVTATTSGFTTELYVGSAQLFVIFTNITAITGTSPTLVTYLQDTPDGANWVTVGNSPSATLVATGLSAKRLNTMDNPTADRIRVNWTVAGTTPSVTFSLWVYAARF